MRCLYRDRSISGIDYIAIVGYKNHGRVYTKEIGYYSEKQLKRRIIIEKISVRNKKEARQLLFELLKKENVKGLKYSHEDRVNIAKSIADRLRHLNYIISIYLVGSVATNEDNEFSDIDLVFIRKYCPSIENCSIIKLGPSEIGCVDIYCHSKKGLDKEPDLLKESIKI